MGRPQEDTSMYQTEQPQEFEVQPQEYQYEPPHIQETDHYDSSSSHQQEISAANSQPQPFPQQQPSPGYGPPPPQPAQYPPQTPLTNPNQPTAAYPPQPQAPQTYSPQPVPPAQYPPQNPLPNPNQPTAAYPPQPQAPQTYPPQPVQFPPQQPSQPYPPQPAPAQFPPRSPQSNPMYQTGPAAYPPQSPQAFPPKPTQASANYSQSPQPQNAATGYDWPQKPIPQANNMAPGIPVAPQPAMLYTEEWTTGIFDCLDDPNNALITAFVPCVTFGQIAEIIDNGRTTCSMNGMVYGLIGFLIWMPCLVSCSYRSKLRAKFGLIEDPAPDWITHFLFEWCALCQEYRELKNRGFDPSIGWEGNVANQSMQQAQVATMPPMEQRMMP